MTEEGRYSSGDSLGIGVACCRVVRDIYEYLAR